MPMFEYQCLKCRKRFELLRTVAERDEEIGCPHCQERQKPLRLTSPFSSRGSSEKGCDPSRRFG